MPRALKSFLCGACGISFERRKLTAEYCCKHCVWQATKGAEYNRQIGRQFAEKNGDTQRGRGEGRAYRKRAGRHEHRIVAEATLGRRLLPGEVVHHIDHNILNNDMFAGSNILLRIMLA